MKSKLWILGAGGHALVVAEAAVLSGKFSEVAFLDDSFSSRKEILPNAFIEGKVADLSSMCKKDDLFVVGVGNPELRMKWFTDAKQSLGAATIVHPFSFVSPLARMGQGTVVLAGAVVQVNAIIGENCIINSMSLVDHDVVVGDHCHIERGSVCCAHSSFSDGFITSPSSVFNSFSKQ